MGITHAEVRPAASAAEPRRRDHAVRRGPRSHIPVSTTHTITGAIVGVGSVTKLSGIRWSLATRIVWAWIFTIPAAAAVGAVAELGRRGAAPLMATPRTGVIVIGGGHNGLVTAGLLAKRGVAVTVLERRHVVGGAAITEQPWGPAWKMTALSYVVSLMPPAIASELQLARFGYKVYPQHGYFAAYPDGRSLMMCADPARRHAEISQFSRRDADEMVRWDAWLGRLGAVLGPLLTTVPPRLGRKRPADLMAALGMAWKLRKLDERGVADLTRLMTMSEADLLEERFESDAMRGVLSVSGVIGTWAGPRSPGTGYVMAHHKIGDLGRGRHGR